MVSKLIWSSVAVMSLAFVAPIHAQQVSTDSVYAPVYIRELQESLREYARAQERYYGGNARYASRVNATGFNLGPRQRVVVLTSTPTGHSGVATHLDAPGVICGIYVGTAPPPIDPDSFEGVPSCRGGNRSVVESPRVTSAANRLRSDLGIYLVAQAAYYAENGVYGESPSQIGVAPSVGTTIVIVTTSTGGHSAVAAQRDVPGLVCAIWMGGALAPLDDGAAQGQASCRMPRRN